MNIRKDLLEARDAWLRALAPHRDPFGRIPLPHPAPMLEEKHVEGCQFMASREAILKKMRTGGVAAEVGVQTGEFSGSILEICSPSKLHLIDIDLTTCAIDKKFNIEIGSGIVQLHEGDSASILKQFPDNYFDFIYIDADHSYQGVKRDIEAGKSKVKEEGFLIFNDYTYWSPAECIDYGVIQAVNELCVEDEWKMIYFALGHYMYCDVALNRPSFRVEGKSLSSQKWPTGLQPEKCNIEDWKKPDVSGSISASTVAHEIKGLQSEIAELKAKLDVFELGWPPGHFYSPVPSLAEVKAREERIFRVPNHIPAVILNESQQIRWIKKMKAFCADQPFAAAPGGPTRFYFENPMYSYGEALIYHAMLRRLRPKNVVEIGSGYSTLVFLDTAELFAGVESTYLCIDPFPELLQSLLRPGDETRITIRKSDLQDVDPELFAKYDGFYYFIVRSTAEFNKDKGFVHDKGFTKWSDVASAVGNKTIHFTRGDFDDYFLIWGIYRQGALSIDDVKVTKYTKSFEGSEDFESGNLNDTFFTCEGMETRGRIVFDPERVVSGKFSAYRKGDLSKAEWSAPWPSIGYHQASRIDCKNEDSLFFPFFPGIQNANGGNSFSPGPGFWRFSASIPLRTLSSSSFRKRASIHWIP